MTAPRTLRAGEAVALSSLSTSRRSPDEVVVRVTGGGAAPDVVALLLGPDGNVRGDADLVFFNQPASVGGAVTVDAGAAVTRIRTGSVEDDVAKVLVGCAGGALDAGRPSSLRVDVSHPRGDVLATAVLEIPAHHRAETLLEVYRWGAGWRLRLLGEGYTTGLDGLVRDHGVQVDGESAPAPAPVTPAFAPVPTPTPSPTPSFPPATGFPPAAAGWAPPPTTTVVPPVPGPSRTPGGPAGRGRRRRTVGVLAGVGALAVVAVVVGASLSGGDPEPGPVAAVAATSAAASTSAASTPTPTPTPTPTVTLAAAAAAVVPATADAQAALALLPVKGRAPMTGYDRSQFGQAWADIDRNGCDTRNDVLRRDIQGAAIDPATFGCVVLTGTLTDPYSGAAIAFTRGTTTSDAVQIDHVVALGDAWQTGAQQLDPALREQFANDPANLLAVDGPLNAQKSDGDAATWLPPNTAFRCTYVAQQVAVKAAYGLWVTAAEHDAIAAILAGCPGATAPPPPPVAAPTTPPPVVDEPDPSSVYYANCTEARAAGAAPIYAGEPGYSGKLDRDGDGVACEN